MQHTVEKIKQADLLGLRHVDDSFHSLSPIPLFKIQQRRPEFLKNLRVDMADLLFDHFGVKFQVQFRDEHKDQFGKYYDRIRITWKKNLDHGFVLNPAELLNC